LKGKDGMLKTHPFDPSASSGQVSSIKSGQTPLAGPEEEE
jgi:hypothetical protein